MLNLGTVLNEPRGPVGNRGQGSGPTACIQMRGTYRDWPHLRALPSNPPISGWRLSKPQSFEGEESPGKSVDAPIA